MSEAKHTVERAIIVAAGIGKRLQPMTLTTPKPLVSVNGVRMIDTIVEALHANGIYEIYVVVGYLKEQFYEWARSYDGDQIISDPRILHPDFTRSGYSCVWTDEETPEWLLTVEDGTVTRCSRTGGRRGWQLYSVSRWTEEDGLRLSAQLELEFICNKNRDIYWDDVALFCHPEDYSLTVYPIRPGDLREIDSFAELCELDPTYKTL